MNEPLLFEQLSRDVLLLFLPLQSHILFKFLFLFRMFDRQVLHVFFSSLLVQLSLEFCRQFLKFNFPFLLDHIDNFVAFSIALFLELTIETIFFLAVNVFKVNLFFAVLERQTFSDMLWNNLSLKIGKSFSLAKFRSLFLFVSDLSLTWHVSFSIINLPNMSQSVSRVASSTFSALPSLWARVGCEER